jgi:uncharacterized membrane protein
MESEQSSKAAERRKKRVLLLYRLTRLAAHKAQAWKAEAQLKRYRESTFLNQAEFLNATMVDAFVGGLAAGVERAAREDGLLEKVVSHERPRKNQTKSH